MLKIVALNDNENEEPFVNEVVATREAQETIAETEYVRAIQLKSKNNTDLCLQLLYDLLETQVLNEGLENNKNDKLWIIKYNCHKNIAMILEEKCNYGKALENYINAILIDNTDVYTLNKFGQLALKLGALDIAEYAFENCLVRNSVHWCAAESMLRTLCKKGNIPGAFNWSIRMYKQNCHNEISLRIIEEIKALYNDNIGQLEKFCNVSLNDFLLKDNITKFKMLFDSNHTCLSNGDQKFEYPIPNLKPFKIEICNWYTIGSFAEKIYTYLKNTNLFFTFRLEDIMQEVVTPSISTDNQLEDQSCKRKLPLGEPFHIDNNSPKNQINERETDTNVEIEKSDIQIIDITNDDSDSNAKSEGWENVKPKPKRRCSDLHFLEQWGWHKNRRYSSRKKTEREEIDNSLNGYLRKIFHKFLGKKFMNKWPFNDILFKQTENRKSSDCPNCSTLYTHDTFNQTTQKEFDTFLHNLKAKPIDLMRLIYNWLKGMSQFWTIKLPTTLKQLYLKLFTIYVSHFDVSNWNQLTMQNYDASFQICLLFLELNFSDHNCDLWQNIYNHLMFNFGMCYIISNVGHEVCKLRLLYLEYLTLNIDNELKKCLSCLEEILQMFLDYQNGQYILHIPNLSDECLQANYIQNLRQDFKRQIEMSEVPHLFEKEAWRELSYIIISNLESNVNNYENDNWLKDFQIQIQLLLQSLWKLRLYDDCLIWAEKCFHYTVSHLIDESKLYRQKILTTAINFIASYVEAIILNEGFHIVIHIGEDELSRLVQNLIKILVYQLDGTFDKSNTHGQELDFKRFLVILHQILLREENDTPIALNVNNVENDDATDFIPNSFMILFTAHEFLGKRQWCTNDNGEFLQYVLDATVLNLKAPIYDSCRDILNEYIEQVTYCLFKYPQKKARSRHLEDHEAAQINLTWPRAIQLFDLYRPENLPEFNSYKLESISADMEQLLLKIIALMPKDYNPTNAVQNIMNFIEGQIEKPSSIQTFNLPYKVTSIFYLLADYYFKSRDFSKAIKYYTLDLATTVNRFDSWAGIALSKASKIETKLNGLDAISLETLWDECEEVLRCFECCVNLKRFQTLLWIEYGSFTYSIHSYFSRYLKHNSENLSVEKFSNIEEKKNKTLTTSYNCFSFATSLQHSGKLCVEESNDVHEEKWLSQYMLGKISEKRKEDPKIYLSHYMMAANYLYESNATYPIKINHSNPTTLCVEALEIFYRINASIIKFLEHEKKISRINGDLFNKVLKNLANSPFAYNKAKLDGNSLNIIKGKFIQKCKSTGNTECQKFKVAQTDCKAIDGITQKDIKTESKTVDTIRRESQESLATGTTGTATGTTSTASSIISSESSSNESDSDSNISSETDQHKSNNSAFYTSKEVEILYRNVIQNIEECATRFPEHYKSIYRLTYYYMNSVPSLCDYDKSEELLLGQYKTSLGNVINGLFYDRKNNNLFNGIWRIPSSEIDRPGSFSTHLVKCVYILIQLLMKKKNHKLLVDMGLNLYRTPDVDKRYIPDIERKELYQQAMTYSMNILRGMFQKNTEKINDLNMLNLLIDIYKIYKKCVKYMNQKEPTFTQLLVDVYKSFIQDKVDNVPENANFLDLAIKLCLYEISSQKNVEKSNSVDFSNSSDCNLTSNTRRTQRAFYIPGLSMRPKVRPQIIKTTSLPYMPVDALPTTACRTVTDQASTPQLMPLISSTQLIQNESPEFQKLFQEYYAKFLEKESKSPSIGTLNLVANLRMQEGFISSQTITTTALNQQNVDVITNVIQSVTAEDNDQYATTIKTTISNVLPTTTKVQGKIKVLNKNKPSTYKPYTRPNEIEQSSMDTINLTPAQSTPNAFIYGGSTQMPVYSNLLPNSTISQDLQIKQKNQVNVARRFKSQTDILTNVEDVYMLQCAQEPSNPIAPISAVTNTINTSANNSLDPTTLETFGNSQIPSYQIYCPINQIGSIKTLQEKLAEKQKASKINDKTSVSVSSSCSSENPTNIIILD